MKKTPSQGPIQYEMTSRKLLYFSPASCSPDSARKKPTTPNTSATIARRSDSGSLIPSARNDIEPEYTFSALAQTAPSAMASSVRSASAVGRWLVNPAVGLSAYLPTLVIVAAAAPMISSQTQEIEHPEAGPEARGPAVGVRRQVARVVAGVRVPARRVAEGRPHRDQEPAGDPGHVRARVRLAT